MIILSGGGGEYIFPLVGHCHHPKPQGPFTIRAGQSIPVQFKNVFPTPTTFLLSVDNSLFSVKQSELIRAKKTINIMVTYNGSPRLVAFVVLDWSHTGHKHCSFIRWFWHLRSQKITPSVVDVYFKLNR